MSGHSKWSTIKRKKGAIDSKRGAIFSKLSREITVSARNGGEDINSNPRLRTAVAKARENNMPSDNIERAIKKGIGGVEGTNYQEIRYEGYGPGGVAIMIDCLTDNRNRTTPNIRSLFSKGGGNLGETGCVSYIFERKGLIIIDGEDSTEDEIMELLIDHGVDDIKREDDNIIIITPPDNYNDIYEIVHENNIKTTLSEITHIPQSLTKLDEKKASQCLKLIGELEDLEDVQHIYSNYDIPDEIMTKISEEQ
ncbi:MAG: YebC/PmpR family DNA-binding transcriptional regulator [Spirochaetota bacterium]|nr:YebC/PmpR family DNA-binding transcriptional regulator [Spirochaetota bacterium]